MKQRSHIPAAPRPWLLLTACGGQRGGAPAASPDRTAAYTSDLLPLDLPLMELTASAAGDGCLYLAGMEGGARRYRPAAFPSPPPFRMTAAFSSLPARARRRCTGWTPPPERKRS